MKKKLIIGAVGGAFLLLVILAGALTRSPSELPSHFPTLVKRPPGSEKEKSRISPEKRERMKLPTLVKRPPDSEKEKPRISPEKRERIKKVSEEAQKVIKDKKVVPGLHELMESDNSISRIESALVLAELGDPAAISLLRKFPRQDGGKYGAQAASILARREEGERGENLALLKEQLESDNWVVRRWAALALGEAGDTSAIPLLRDALDDPVIAVRICAAHALALLGDESIIPYLREHLNHFDYAVANTAAEALAKLGDKSALPFFQQALENEDIFIRLDAAKFLAFLGDDSGIPMLEQALNSPDELVRLIASRNLVEIAARR